VKALILGVKEAGSYHHDDLSYMDNFTSMDEYVLGEISGVKLFLAVYHLATYTS
jgi:hypothetical protein